MAIKAFGADIAALLNCAIPATPVLAAASCNVDKSANTTCVRFLELDGQNDDFSEPQELHA